MAINKDKNVNIQITFPKEDAEHLKAMNEAFNDEGIKTTKSQILLQAFREYLKMVVAVGSMHQNKEAEESPRKEKKDA